MSASLLEIVNAVIVLSGTKHIFYSFEIKKKQPNTNCSPKKYGATKKVLIGHL